MTETLSSCSMRKMTSPQKSVGNLSAKGTRVECDLPSTTIQSTTANEAYGFGASPSVAIAFAGIT